MKVLLIPDKFKGSVTAEGVIKALSQGIAKSEPNTEIFKVMASDGGDGFLDAIQNYISLDRVEIDTVDPLGRPIKAYYLYRAATKTAYIELAKASGIELLSNDELNVMETSTLGTGMQIKNAIKRGAKNIIIGLGGSATNDGGTGIAHILGYRFLDAKGNELDPIGKNLIHISKIENIDHSTLWEGISFTAVNDVTNPLFGPEGAAYVYAKQKGANNEQIQALDKGLKNLDHVVKSNMGLDQASLPGTGAAGGTAYGLKTFFNAEFISGIEFLFKLAEIPQLLKETPVDYIITGEGKIDGQTLHGKLIKGVMDIGIQYKIPVIAVCGKLDVPVAELKSKGLKDVLEIMDTTQPLQYSIDNAPALIEKTIYNYFQQQKST
ncbi:glycerate kinase [Sediminicola sp. 1XM1-17]|uniref:glycerate kinase n=1 Tax=Sediminicola sp. 1XM1-17 TaxID=3127702 RepID=UPI00307760AF